MAGRDVAATVVRSAGSERIRGSDVVWGKWRFIASSCACLNSPDECYRWRSGMGDKGQGSIAHFAVSLSALLDSACVGDGDDCVTFGVGVVVAGGAHATAVTPMGEGARSKSCCGSVAILGLVTCQ